MSEKKLADIKLFAMDVDGTLTDGKIYMGNHRTTHDGFLRNELFKAFDVKDGLGIKLLQKHDIIPAIITGRTSQSVSWRANEVGVTEVCQGEKDKAEALLLLMEKYNLKKEQVAYIGDDLNDLGAIKTAGITFAPADCSPFIVPYIDFLLTRPAGKAPVREAIDMILMDIGVSFDDFTDF